MQPGRKYGEDCQQVLDKLLFRRERFPINDHQISMVPFTESFKIAIAEPHESIPMSNENAPNLSKFHHLHEPMTLFALVVETTSNLLHQFIDLERMLCTLDLEFLHLLKKIKLLGCT